MDQPGRLGVPRCLRMPRCPLQSGVVAFATHNDRALWSPARAVVPPCSRPTRFTLWAPAPRRGRGGLRAGRPSPALHAYRQAAAPKCNCKGPVYQCGGLRIGFFLVGMTSGNKAACRCSSKMYSIVQSALAANEPLRRRCGLSTVLTGWRGMTTPIMMCGKSSRTASSNGSVSLSLETKMTRSTNPLATSRYIPNAIFTSVFFSSIFHTRERIARSYGCPSTKVGKSVPSSSVECVP